MSAMLRFKSVEDFEKFKRETGVREARPISGKHSAAPVRRAPSESMPGTKVSCATPPVSQDIRLAPVAAEPKKESEIERRFAQQVQTANLPQPERNWYHIPDRMFTLDFAWPDRKIAVEIQGHAHRIRSKFAADIEKRALALLSGWVVMELSGAEVRSGRGIEWFVQLWKQRA